MASGVLRLAPLVGLLYSTLVICFAEGVHISTLAAPPVCPWYLHKRGICVADVLRAAGRAIDGVDVLVSLSHYDNLQEPGHMSRTRKKRGLDIAP